EHWDERLARLQALPLKTGRAWAIKASLRELGGVSAEGLGVAALEALVLLGHPFASGTAGEGGADAARAPGQRVDVLRPSNYQRHERGTQLQDPSGKKNAYGYRNRENRKTAIFFHCGGLNLYPVTL